MNKKSRKEKLEKLIKESQELQQEPTVENKSTQDPVQFAEKIFQELLDGIFGL